MISDTIPGLDPGRYELVEGDIADPPFADGSFDAILTVHVYHLVPDPAHVAAESARMLARPGVLLNGHDDRAGDDGRREAFAAWDDILRELGWSRPKDDRRASTVKVMDEWRRLGATVDEIAGPEWEVARPPAQDIEFLTRRLWSSAWPIPDDIFDEAARRLRAWAAERYGEELDTPSTRRLRFVIERGRFA